MVDVELEVFRVFEAGHQVVACARLPRHEGGQLHEHLVFQLLLNVLGRRLQIKPLASTWRQLLLVQLRCPVGRLRFLPANAARLHVGVLVRAPAAGHSPAVTPNAITPMSLQLLLHTVHRVGFAPQDGVVDVFFGGIVDVFLPLGGAAASCVGHQLLFTRVMVGVGCLEIVRVPAARNRPRVTEVTIAAPQNAARRQQVCSTELVRRHSTAARRCGSVAGVLRKLASPPQSTSEGRSSLSACTPACFRGEPGTPARAVPRRAGRQQG